MKITRSKLGEFVRSAAVGVAATVVDLVLLVALTELVGLTPTQSNIPALSAGLAVQFFGNKFFAFGDYSRNYAKQGTQFALVEVGAFSLNAFTFHVVFALTQFPYVAIRLACSSAVYVLYSFPLWGWIFKKRPARTRRNAARSARVGA